MKVELRPIEKTKWHGLNNESNFTRSKVVEAVVNSQGRYNLALSEDRIKHLERVLGVNLDLAFTGKPHPTFSEKAWWVELPNHTVLYDDTNPIEELKLGILKGTGLVALSEDAISEEHTHYIFSEEQEVEAKMTKVAKKQRANELALNMHKDKKIWLLWVIKGENYKGKSDGFINVLIDELVETNSDDFLQYADMDDAMLSSLAIIHESIYKNILTKDGPAIYYGTERLGYDVQEAANYINQPEHQVLKVRLMEKLNA